MAEVQWIKIKVGMFDGQSFKKIKRAKLGGESYRDKLTAVWFELMDFAGKCNRGGAFINAHEIPYSDMEDIATMIDREAEELQLCMNWFINEGMVEIIDDVYQLSNWSLYQNEAGLEKIREQKRIAQAKWREKKKLLEAGAEPVDSTVESTGHLPSISISSSKSLSKSKKEGDSKGETKVFVKPTLEEVRVYCKERGKGVNAEKWYNYYTANGWKVGKNPMKDWKAAVRTWEPDEQPKKSDTGFATNNPFLEMLEERRNGYEG